MFVACEAGQWGEGCARCKHLNEYCFFFFLSPRVFAAMISYSIKKIRQADVLHRVRISDLGGSEIRGPDFGGPCNKGPTISGTICGSPIFGNPISR